MSTPATLQTDEPAAATQPAASTQDLSQHAPRELAPVLGARWALSGRHLVACLAFGGLFLYLNYLPLDDPRLWLHVHQGAEILESQALPRVDAAQPLTEGMPIVQTTWLAQVALAAAEAWGGPQAISNQFAVIGLVSLLVLARVFYVQTARVSLMLVGVGAVLLFGGGPAVLAGPAAFGALGLAVLLWLVRRMDGRDFERQVPRQEGSKAVGGSTWPCCLLTVILFVVWANLHGSFLLGLAVLACYAVGRALEVGWKTRSVVSAVADPPTQRWVLLAECAVAATLVNPYGLDLIVENLRLVASDDLVVRSGWTPLVLPTTAGVVFLGSLVLLTAVLRNSRRPVRPAEILLLGAFGSFVVATGRAMSWYAPVFVFAVMPHLGELVARRRPAKARPAEPDEQAALTPRHFAVTLICGLVLWCSFSFAPISNGILGGNERKPEHLFGPGMPVAVAEHLRQHPSEGMIYAPTDWADWLVWSNSPDIKVHMTSNTHWVPKSVWADHHRISQAGSGWQEILARCAIDTIVVDKERQTMLSQAVRRSARWKTVLENERALVATRVAPLEDQQDQAGATLAQRHTRVPSNRGSG